MDDIAQQILSALRLGSVPSVGLDRLAVGRDRQLSELSTQLDEVGRGHSAIKFISGNYGTGKSFFCASVREKAFEKGFAVSTVIISPDTPLAKFDIVVGKAFDNLRLPSKRSSCALSDLLEKWFYQLMKKIATLEGLNLDDATSIAEVGKIVLPKIVNELSMVQGLDASFVNTVNTYMQAKIKRDSALANDALGWLKANSNLAGNRKHKLGVRGNLSPLVALNFIKGLLYILQGSDYKGMLLIIDEIETIQRLPNERQRLNSYESLRVLVDHVAENTIPGLMLVLTGTPKLLEDRRYGIPSYEPLKQRFEQLKFPDGRHSLRQPVITLNGFGRAELLEVGMRVRDIHSHCLNWQANERLSAEHIDHLVEVAVNAFGGEVERSPRSFLREVVHICDMLHEHPLLSMEEYFLDENDVAGRLNPHHTDETVATALKIFGS
jgi:hypothetical protein